MKKLNCSRNICSLLHMLELTCPEASVSFSVKKDFDGVVCIISSCPFCEISHYEFWVVLCMPKAFFTHFLVMIKLLVNNAQKKSSLRDFEDYHLLLPFCRDTKVYRFEVLHLIQTTEGCFIFQIEL